MKLNITHRKPQSIQFQKSKYTTFVNPESQFYPYQCNCIYPRRWYFRSTVHCHSIDDIEFCKINTDPSLLLGVGQCPMNGGIIRALSLQHNTQTWSLWCLSCASINQLKPAAAAAAASAAASRGGLNKWRIISSAHACSQRPTMAVTLWQQ